MREQDYYLLKVDRPESYKEIGFWWLENILEDEFEVNRPNYIFDVEKLSGEYHKSSEYMDEVKGTARTAYDEYLSEEDEDDTWKVVDWVVDSNHMLMYYPDFIVENSEQPPDEWESYWDNHDTVRSVHQAMAYTMFRQDVYQKLDNIVQARKQLGDMTKYWEYSSSEGNVVPYWEGYYFKAVSIGHEFGLFAPDDTLLEVYSLGAFKHNYPDYEYVFVQKVNERIEEHKDSE